MFLSIDHIHTDAVDAGSWIQSNGLIRDTSISPIGSQEELGSLRYQTGLAWTLCDHYGMLGMDNIMDGEVFERSTLSRDQGPLAQDDPMALNYFNAVWNS